MTEHVDMNLTEAVEAAAMALAKEMHIDWIDAGYVVRLTLRERVLPLVNAAAPLIVDQIWKDVESRKYNVGKYEL